MTRTVVFFHAHPDDEALLTGGTMARLADEGHRVVLVTATDGEAGLASSELTAANPLAELRRQELRASAEILGCARVVMLGYADSGSNGQPGPSANAFSAVPPDLVARRLAEILRDEACDVLSIYDASGGYGHPDHVQVHRSGARAAALARTPTLLEATVDRRALQRALWAAAWATRHSPDFRPSRFNDLYTHPDRITHRVNVSRYLGQKRAAMEAHCSQATADGATRALARYLALPSPLFRIVFGREWFVEQHRSPTKPPLTDVMASL